MASLWPQADHWARHEALLTESRKSLDDKKGATTAPGSIRHPRSYRLSPSALLTLRLFSLRLFSIARVCGGLNH